MKAMPKTITIRLDNKKYKLFKAAAESENRPISNFIENAAHLYLLSENYVSDLEMNEIIADKNLTAGLEEGLRDIKTGKYKIVR